jgi:MFS family permease
MAVSLALVAAAFLLRSVMTELWQFYLFSVIIFAGTPGSTMMPASKLVMTWFPSVRGRMMGRVTAGNNLGSGAAAPIIVALIALVGWRWTYGIIGIALLGLMMFVIVIIRDSADDVEKEKGKRWTPGEIGSQDQLSPSGGMLASEAMRTSAFWFLIVGMTLQQFVRTGVVSQLFPHLQQVGFTTIAATIAMTLLAFGGMSSKLIFGWLSESITARLAFVLVMILQGIGMTALLVSGGSVIAWVAILIFGLGMGGVGALTPLVFTEMFGLKQFGRIMGLSRMAIVLPVLMGPILTGLIYDSTGSYDLMFGITIGLLVVSIGAFLLSRAPGESATSSGSNS